MTEIFYGDRYIYFAGMTGITRSSVEAAVVGFYNSRGGFPDLLRVNPSDLKSSGLGVGGENPTVEVSSEVLVNHIELYRMIIDLVEELQLG